MKRYLNSKQWEGTETIDELDSNDFKSYRDFKRELNRLADEYAMCQQSCYISQKACKGWN